MLETVDLDKSLAQDEYKKVFKSLQFKLSELQRKARNEEIPVVAVFEGWEAAGKGSCINRMVQQLDPRGFKVFPVSAPNKEEQLRPFLWRFAINMPKKGKMAVFDRSWYGRILVERIEKLIPGRIWKKSYDEILQFEKQHVIDGSVIVKFWLHISKNEQKKRFKKISRDPALSWKIGKAELREHKRYNDYEKAVEEMLERTSTANAPWTIVEATCKRFARVKVLETVISAIENALQNKKAIRGTPASEKATVQADKPDETTILDQVDLSVSLEKPDYQSKMKKLQAKFRDLEHEMYIHRLPVIIAYEGWDAAGKGGNIKRLTEKLDPRGYEVTPIAAPSKEELQHHYLWRFWKEIPKAGHLSIFDRTWYGRVLVERIENFCSPVQWQRAYEEIREFERMLTSFGTVIVKFWIHISKEEQLRRFKERESIKRKQWKITDEDWRNRDNWNKYRQAVVDMIERTSTTYSPWTIIAGNDKYFARIQALETVCRAIESGLKKGG